MPADDQLEKRLEALDATGLLDSAPEETFDRLTRLATRFLGVPVALISLVDRDRQFFKSQQGLPEPWATRRQTPLSHSFCKHVVSTGEPLVIRDAAAEPLVSENPARRDLGVVAYLGVPLATADGFVLGSLCAISDDVHPWRDEDLSTMLDLAAMVMTEINLRGEIRDRKAAGAELALLADELQHRVKNSIAVAQAVALLSIRAATSLDGLAKVVGERLVALGRSSELVGDAARREVQLRDLLERELSAFGRQLRIALEGPELCLRPQAAVALSMIVHELATNAAKYGALSIEGGQVAITWSRDAGEMSIQWRESGPGLTVGAPGRRGFGSLLIDRLARHQLGGSAAMTYPADGLVATIEADCEMVLCVPRPAGPGSEPLA